MGEEIFDLAVPVMVTGGLRTVVQVVDFFMVSLALGAAAVAALEFGFQFYVVVVGVGLALSSGTISVVSRFYGGGDYDRANLVLKQSLWLTLAISVPLVVVGWSWATPLVDLLSDDARAVELGAIYLKFLVISAPFHFWTLIGARALAGVGDTRTPMYIRSTSLPVNTIVNALLIFGLGPFPRLGIMGAAIGTSVANILQAVIFTIVLLSGRFGVQLTFGGSQFDFPIIKEIVRVSLPLSGTRFARTLARFPFLFVLGTLGTNVVAAFAIGRRFMALARTPSWGYATAASTLVGQSIGDDDEETAEEYGWQSLRITFATQLLIVVLLCLGARQLALAFGADNVDLTVTFIYVFAVAIIGSSLTQTLQGALRGAGDTSFPFYGTLLGNYLVRLPIAALALPVGLTVGGFGVSFAPGFGLGLPAIFLAIWADIYTRTAVNWIRFRSDRWKEIGRTGAAWAGAGAD